IVNGWAGNDELFGGPGDDILRGHSGSDAFYADTTIDGSDRMLGGEGLDTVSYFDRTVGVNVTLDDGQANDGETGENDELVDIEDVVGGWGPDVLVGSDLANSLDGFQGNDEIH